MRIPRFGLFFAQNKLVNHSTAETSESGGSNHGGLLKSWKAAQILEDTQNKKGNSNNERQFKSWKLPKP
jgi:hypothetical protein